MEDPRINQHSVITDAQAQKILEAMKSGFEKVDQRFDKLEYRFGKKFEGINGQLVGINGRLDKLEQTVGSLVIEVAAQGQTLKGLVTRDEFNIFKDETLTHFDGLAGQIANLQEVETLKMKTR